jgi:phosphatidylserine/phosphatidylglycerophosphate/cardiolipin synthase-like enzyme
VNPQPEHLATLQLLGSKGLKELADALQTGGLKYGFSEIALRPLAGSLAADLQRALTDMLALGLAHNTLSAICRSMSFMAASRESEEQSSQLVLSGPTVPGTPVVDTRTTMSALLDEAVREIIVCSFVFRNAAQFFERLARRHDAQSDLRVVFVVDLTHLRAGAQKKPAELGLSFLAEFRKAHWPGIRLPEIWHDARLFRKDAEEAGVMHAKVEVVDRKASLITSANFTEAGQERNIEAGILTRQARHAARLADYLEGLMASGILDRIH